MIGICGDLHIGTRSGDVNFLDFQTQWLESFMQDCLAKKVDYIIQVGDFFDVRKSMGVHILDWVMETFIPMVEKYAIPWMIIVGNHDIYYRDSNEIYSTKLLEKLLPDMISVVNRFEHIEINDTEIFLCPWLDEKNRIELPKALGFTKARYMIGHLELAGFPLYKGVSNDHGMDSKPFHQFERVITGHYHTISSAHNVTYIGSPYHLTWADYPDGDNRGWFLFDPVANSLELQKNATHESLFALIEYNDDHDFEMNELLVYEGNILKIVVTKKENEKRFKNFLKILNEIKVIDYQIIDNTVLNIGSSETVDLSKPLESDTVVIFKDYIESSSADAGFDSQTMTLLMNDIYDKALNK
jgi:DNA repair exonuclease SbcCD nuclease subunit